MSSTLGFPVSTKEHLKSDGSPPLHIEARQRKSLHLQINYANTALQYMKNLFLSSLSCNRDFFFFTSKTISSKLMLNYVKYYYVWYHYWFFFYTCIWIVRCWDEYPQPIKVRTGQSSILSNLLAQMGSIEEVRSH